MWAFSRTQWPVGQTGHQEAMVIVRLRLLHRECSKTHQDAEDGPQQLPDERFFTVTCNSKADPCHGTPERHVAPKRSPSLPPENKSLFTSTQCSEWEQARTAEWAVHAFHSLFGNSRVTGSIVPLKMLNSEWEYRGSGLLGIRTALLTLLSCGISKCTALPQNCSVYRERNQLLFLLLQHFWKKKTWSLANCCSVSVRLQFKKHFTMKYRNIGWQ